MHGSSRVCCDPLRFSCVFEYCVVYSVRGSQGSDAMLTNGFPETRVQILEFGRGVVVVRFGLYYYGPCS